jgi:hypothetical protein
MRTIHGFALLGIALLAACGGGGGGGTTQNSPQTQTYATSLSYADPTSTGYRFVLNAASSTSTRVVLDLMGPVGTSARGVAVYLSASSAAVDWATPGSGQSLTAAGGAFNLGGSPRLIATKLESGNLQAGVFQKGGSPATYGTAPILSVALSLKSNVSKGQVILGAQSGQQSIVLNADGTTSAISPAFGTLSAN